MAADRLRAGGPRTDNDRMKGKNPRAAAVPEPTDPKAASRGGRCDLCEKFGYGFLLTQESDGEPAGMQIVALGLGDELFGDRAQGLGFSESGADAPMLNQTASEVR